MTPRGSSNHSVPGRPPVGRRAKAGSPAERSPGSEASSTRAQSPFGQSRRTAPCRIVTASASEGQARQAAQGSKPGRAARDGEGPWRPAAPLPDDDGPVGLSKDDFIDGLEPPLGAASFIEMAANADVCLFV